jgi:predicted AAA+ superfamily ATPase
MLKRKISKTLLKWKAEKSRECLLIKGARQVGKTFIIRKFGATYNSFIELNFFENSEYKTIFKSGNLTCKEIIKRISLEIPSARFIPGETLLFLDEIQECPEARTALKYIAQDNRFDCIASGSMLGIAYKTMSSIPVGYEKQTEMFSLDFEEYLWAFGFNNNAIKNLKSYFDNLEKIPSSINDSMLKRLREYAVIGGMPAVVNKFLTTNNFSEAHEEQMKIFNSYLDDIAKYAPTAEKPKARKCYLSIPRQLAKENKKFQYSKVEAKSSARKFDSSLEWLRDAGLIKYCNNISAPVFPLAAYIDDNYFKVYLTDIGMLNVQYGFEMKAAIVNNTLKGPAKGGIYENLIADFLIKKDRPLNYYKPSENRQEIEFLLTVGENIVPLEVKAGNNRTVSLDEFISDFNPPYAVKLIAGNLGKVDKKITYPLYMALFL